MGVFAAGVLLSIDGMILSLKRLDGNGYGFPCGKVEMGEHPIDAAIRECFEETGYVVATSTSSYYDGVDDENKVVRIYLAKVLSEGDLVFSREGTVEWVLPSDLSNSKWKEFNEEVLKFFNI